MPATTAAVAAIEVEATDGAAALELERRLAHLSPTSIGRGDRWIVEIPAVPMPEEVEAVVRRWIDDLGLPGATMRIDGRELHITRNGKKRGTHRASHGEFIG